MIYIIFIIYIYIKKSVYRRRYISLIYIFYRYINMLFIKICKNIGYIYILV